VGLKHGDLFAGIVVDASANRTKVGLKQVRRTIPSVGEGGANRTKVGLKHVNRLDIHFRVHGANRTKVGLKRKWITGKSHSR